MCGSVKDADPISNSDLHVRPRISGSHKTFKVTDALVFKSNLSSDPVLTQFVGRGVVLRSPRDDNL